MFARWRHRRRLIAEARGLERQAQVLEQQADVEQQKFDAHMKKMVVGIPFYFAAFSRPPGHLDPANYEFHCRQCGYRGAVPPGLHLMSRAYQECPYCHEPLGKWWVKRKQAQALRAEAAELRREAA